MFENQQPTDVEKFIGTSPDTRRLFNHHKKLDAKLQGANAGVVPLDDLTLAGLKKEKLQAKAQLQRMWDSWEQSRH